MLITKCLFPAAGYGTRFLPATKAMPKEMMPIVNKPLIEFGVQEAYEACMTDICIVTGRGKRAIEDHFDISYELEHQIAGSDKENYLNQNRNLLEHCNFSYTRQMEMKGLGHAVLAGKKLINGNPFGVILADDLCFNDGKNVMQQLGDAYEKYQCNIVAVMEVPKEDTKKYGVIAGKVLDQKTIRVNKLVEKPSPDLAPSSLAIIGRYILTPEIFRSIEGLRQGAGGEIQLTDALCLEAQRGNVIAIKFEGIRFDCGSLDGFVDATKFVHTNKLFNRF